MKTRFTTIDILASIAELRNKLQGMRVQQVYDVDNKTYLIKLSKHESKAVLLLESGNRIHTTEFEWPKNPAPSGFSMKLRKHLKSRRFEKIDILGVDRVVDIQFGSSEAAYHVILELYDRGNICLTDHQYTILNLLRVRTDDSQDVKLVVRQKYPIENAKQKEDLLSHDRISEIVSGAKSNESIKKLLNPHVVFGPALIEHVLQTCHFIANVKVCDINIPEDITRIKMALEMAQDFFENYQDKFKEGYIIQKKEKRCAGNDDSELITYEEFHPYLFKQFNDCCFAQFECFDQAVDEFFSKLEGQKLDMKTVQQEKSAMKKLENVRKDHVKRVGDLQKIQQNDKAKAELIEINLDMVERALLIIRSAIANQIDWVDIQTIIQDAKQQNDPVAMAIKHLKLDQNRFVMLLANPYDKPSGSLVEIDLDLSAYANARRYYDQKRHASKKEQKTLEASKKALKSAERKTKQTLKEVSVAATINKARKTFWFEKFLWFISSENYLVIGGRDQQQNEMIVKKYMRMGDVYVHADLHGASSIVVKNPTAGETIPPKTLNEAGTMAVCSSAAWEAKVVTSAWWVQANQVSKTAPSGEYLTTGSFMIRGKKNYLPPCHLIMGFGFLFKLDDDFIELHKNDRKVKVTEADAKPQPNIQIAETEEIVLNDDDDNSSDDDEDKATDEKQLEDETKEEISEFPDTQISFEPAVAVAVADPRDSLSNNKTEHENGAHKIVYLGDDKPVVVKHSIKKNERPVPHIQSSAANEQQNKQPAYKRGQKAKIKKIKHKYKDQDEEEKELRMQILASAGKEKESKKKKEIRNEKKSKNQKKGSSMPAAVILHDEHGDGDPVITPPTTTEQGDSEDDDDNATHIKDETVKVLDSLTGCPLPEDGLLFAVPICAPYSTLQNYKFKVKMTPGTGKRGKAAKTAVQMFLKFKEITGREKDLLKSVKDQDISRNLPGKVKLSAINKAR